MADERVMTARPPRPTRYRDGGAPATQAFAFVYLLLLGGVALPLAVPAAKDALHQANPTVRGGDLHMVFATAVVLLVSGLLIAGLILEARRQRQTVAWGVACQGRITKVDRASLPWGGETFKLIFEYDGPAGMATGEHCPVAPLGRDMKPGDPVTIICYRGQVLLYELCEIQMR
ncbi:MAG TPA: hypothetical protein VGO93_09230 [Candidatus Xenobia bacterium]|jgi:hypothetical protein